ncbi:succinylglutamate desuccinylase/aspartoacylase domain-containing protein [Oceanibacterium hippocampi]|uniref:succinylglutamate desuccinylase/aspartoacylase domain-containing protein n=1 Tax=Oceanibacterium hippocampi TaxID=745714 RepID=UPI001C38284A|nr:succinylglutamate desuccinylase/aspartoacylase family protein [Oceanibacterium hippocampi]
MADSTETASQQLPLVDIAPYRRGNCGVEYVHRLDSGRPGPSVVVSAITHGNEPCGLIALDYLLRRHVRPLLGVLTLIFCNVRAYQTYDPSRPLAARFLDEDMNRLWEEPRLSGAGSSAELKRAREIRPFVEAADILLDLHSMQSPGAALALAGTAPKGRRLAESVGYPEFVIADRGHENGTRMRDFGAFDAPRARAAALLVECGQHLDPASGEMALTATLRLLAALDMLEEAAAPPPPVRPQVFVNVTEAIAAGSGDFAFLESYRNMTCIARAGTPIARDGRREIVTPYDDCYLVMPSPRIRPGLTAVRFGKRAA